MRGIVWLVKHQTCQHVVDNAESLNYWDCPPVVGGIEALGSAVDGDTPFARDGNSTALVGLAEPTYGSDVKRTAASGATIGFTPAITVVPTRAT